jgi:pyridoxal phosphate enzyme (YggS family)
MIDARDVRERLDDVERRIERVERTWDHPVSVMAVTKGFDGDAIEAAAAAGCETIGENYAQELLHKRDSIERAGVAVEFIGHLQSNKVRQIASIVDRWSSVDRVSVAAEIAKRQPGGRVLVQVNSTGEPQKGGCAPEDTVALVQRCRDLGLSVEGLMTVGPTGEPPHAAESGFRLVRDLVDRLDLVTCSMGMTNDLEVAVTCGSTNVRLGTALFGPRPPRVSTSVGDP